jgi:ABC-type spermidine/putrescine transport system permease subunit I
MAHQGVLVVGAVAAIITMLVSLLLSGPVAYWYLRRHQDAVVTRSEVYPLLSETVAR